MRRFSPLLAFFLVVSCSTKKASSPPDPYADRDGFCAEWAAAVCNDRVADACVASKEDCVAAQTASCEDTVPSDRYSEKTAEACVAAVGAAYADAVLTTDDLAVVAFGNECDKVISGSSGKDSTCTVDSDCDRDQDLACVVKSGKTEGTCQVPVPVDNGASCTAKDAVCSEGFYCDDRNHCVEGGVADDPCDATAPCGKGLVCKGGSADGGGTPATCVELAAVKADCASDADCASSICVINATTGNGKCSDKIILAPSEPACAKLQ